MHTEKLSKPRSGANAFISTINYNNRLSALAVKARWMKCNFRELLISLVRQRENPPHHQYQHDLSPLLEKLKIFAKSIKSTLTDRQQFPSDTWWWIFSPVFRFWGLHAVLAISIIIFHATVFFSCRGRPWQFYVTKRSNLLFRLFSTVRSLSIHPASEVCASRCWSVYCGHHQHGSSMCARYIPNRAEIAVMSEENA